MTPKRLTELFSQYQNLELVLDSLPDAVIVHDLDRRITFVNQVAERLLGLSRAEVVGRDCHQVLRGGFCGSRCAFCEGCVPAVDLRASYPLVVTSHTGEQRRVEMTVLPMRDLAGEVVGVVALARDVTEVEALRRAMGRERSFRGLVGQHHLMQEVYQLVRDVAPSDVPVLIQGESGTGKELVARAIHAESDRERRPFVAVNCGALPEGLLESELFGHVRGAFTGAVRDKKGRFELADGGTLFLDEVGELTPAMQVKLLRVLETQRFEPVGGERPVSVNVRILSATNRDLGRMVGRGSFRQDLYYRLCVVPIVLPPLRNRRTDILLLADHFLTQLAEEQGRVVPALGEEAVKRLVDHPWPGNVRQLRNALQYALVKARGPLIEAVHLPRELGPEPGGERTARRVGRRPKLTPEAARIALAAAGGNRAKAARALGVGRSTFYRYLDGA